MGVVLGGIPISRCWIPEERGIGVFWLGRKAVANLLNKVKGLGLSLDREPSGLPMDFFSPGFHLGLSVRKFQEGLRSNIAVTVPSILLE